MARLATELDVEQRREVAAWYDATRESLPEPVRKFLDLHRGYLAAGEGDPLRREVDKAYREIRRALHLTPSSEKRRSVPPPLDGIPKGRRVGASSKREELEARLARGRELARWHRRLGKGHVKRAKRLEKRLARMPPGKPDDGAKQVPEEIPPVEEIALTKGELAEADAAADRFVEHLQEGERADPAMKPAGETLMPRGAVLVHEEHASLTVQVPEDLAGAEVVKEHHDLRTRYDFSVAVTRIELDVEKKVVVDEDGKRHVLSASTLEYGPPRFSVTWGALATLATLVGQFALPLHRLGTLLSTGEKCLSASALGRMLHYVAQRLVPIYLELAVQLSQGDYLAGDDTSCRVLELSAWLEKVRADPSVAKSERPPWAGYATPRDAEESLRRCEQLRRDRIRLREDGDRGAVRTREETPSLGVVIGKRFPFESTRRNGDGPKEALHTTVVAGRSVAADPTSLVVFYRSHLGSCGNLFEWLLAGRDPKRKDVVLQGDLSSSNLVASKALLERFKIRFIGCYAHARRPFALYEDEDPVMCGAVLHQFQGIALQEEQLGVFGRNPKNVLAVRQNDSRELWEQIRDFANTMAKRWSKATNLGAAARYVINHFEELTAYLDDPRLEPDNTHRERMLRTEKLIEGSALFRKTLEGRFVLDVVRTLLQTAVAAGAPAYEYLVSVLRADEDEVAAHPERFTPRAWAAANVKAPVATPPAK